MIRVRAFIFFISVALLLILAESAKVMISSNKSVSFVTSTNQNVTVNVKKIIPKNSKGPKTKNIKPVVTVPKKKKLGPQMITPDIVQEWAERVSEKFFIIEESLVHRDTLLKSFSDIKIETRDGIAIVEKMARNMEELLLRRTDAAEKIMRAAEDLARKYETVKTPDNYQFNYAVQLDEIKPTLAKPDNWERDLSCRSLDKLRLRQSDHFSSKVTLDATSVHVSPEVFDCDERVLPHIYWSEELLSVYRENFVRDATIDYQYFCSARGFMRYYPAARWENMFQVEYDPETAVYDCRLRPWYVAAGGAPRDLLILFDASGSMHNSSNKVIGEMFTQALLTALTDDDQVNVLRFNVITESPILCFNEKLVPANHVNAAAMLAAMKSYNMTNETKMAVVLENAVRMLQRQRADTERAAPCQQALVLLTDQIYANYSELMRHLDPEGHIRLFVLWLHDPNGLRDSTYELGEYISCERDGLFAELITSSDVTDQVLRILQVLERPLVAQMEKRLRVFSDVYAHVEDPRRGEVFWHEKENAEQEYRYRELRRNKERLLSSGTMMRDHQYQMSLEEKGQYYEGIDVNYRLQISVSVPVFDHIKSENITRKLDEEKQRESTRTYPVNRLLGVVGVDIPLDHLKLILPYHELGAGGSLFIVDHRGNIVLHDNLKPLFDGDILKPGYRTVDMVDLEQPAADHYPRHYPREWLDFRKQVIIDLPKGNRTVQGKNVFEGGMRVLHETREYHWRRVLDHYTAVVVLPKYNRRHAVPDSNFTQKLAEDAFKTLSDNPEFAVHSDWLYCRHVDPYFDSRELELQHFLRRRRDEANFRPRKLEHHFSPLQPTLLEKTYQCNEKLMASLCKEAIATAQWAKDVETQSAETECSTCTLGSTTVFFASESGLTRSQQFFAVGAHADPPEGTVWSRGPSESWYRRAAAAPDTLVIHAPVYPVRKRRNSFIAPPKIGDRAKWMTAARTLGSPNKGLIGVSGYHFHPHHLDEVFDSITNHPTDCDDVAEDCKPQCDGENWSCVLIDESGWVVATGAPSEEDEPLRQHLATLYPTAMANLLNASVFKLHWLHDYQAVCFEIEKPVYGSAQALTSIVNSLWKTISLIVYAAREFISVLTLVGLSSQVYGDTQIEKDKRRKRVRKDFEREKYERLFDKHVLVNRSRYSTCDRSRPLYELQTPAAMQALTRHPHACTWPLVGALVPKTNLMLLAIYKLCPATERMVPDPMSNELVEMPEEQGVHKSDASRLACWRNRVPLPGRPPATTCYPHNYTKESGYRQCGAWRPDPEPEEAPESSALQWTTLGIFIFLSGTMDLFYIYYKVLTRPR